jgi:DNA-binding XRE family transcriptional regulator
MKSRHQEVIQFKKEYDLTQKALADLLGVTRIQIYYMERGIKKPSKTLRLFLDCIEERFFLAKEIEKEKGEIKKRGKDSRHL